MTDQDHSPASHPSAPHGKTGVLLGNLGTPDGTGYWPMRRYLSEFLSDRRVIDYARWKWQPLLQLVILSRRPFKSGAAYKKIWNTKKDEGPLLTTTREQSEKLALVLRDRLGDDIVVDFCMRYGNPSTSSRVASLIKQGCERILFFPLYPQYAGASTATANDHFFRALGSAKWQPAVRTVAAYYDHPLYIESLAASLNEAFETPKSRPDILLASFHGMPERYRTEGDPYYCQCMKTTRLLRERLGWKNTEITISFQSKFGPEEWLKPASVDEVRRLAHEGNKRIAVISPAFSCDCLETLEEINGEIRESFEKAGGESFSLVPCLNARDDHIQMMADIISKNIVNWR